MTPFAEAVSGYIRQRGLISEGARVVVALSGGPDSCALFLVLMELAEANRLLPPVAAAHFHHGVRGTDADEDAGFCAALCAKWGVACVVGLGAVPVRHGGYSSDTARRLRYAFLEETAADVSADLVATAHTADDQAETVLGRVFRGTSVDGLAGIPPARRLKSGISVVRPILTQRRSDIEEYCRFHGMQPRHDPSNDKVRYTRTRLRRLLPELAADFNPSLYGALTRLADNAAVDSELLTQMAEILNDEAVTYSGPGEVRLRRDVLLAAHPALRRRVLLAQIRVASGAAAEAAATWESVSIAETVLRSHKKQMVPGGVTLALDGDELCLSVPRGGASGAYVIPLSAPGSVTITERGVTVEAEEVPVALPVPQRARCSPVVDLAVDPTAELIVRSLEAGERFVPFGFVKGTKLVRDALVAEKVSAKERADFPVVARADTREILWVVGIAQAESTRITASTQRRLRLTVRYNGTETKTTFGKR